MGELRGAKGDYGQSHCTISPPVARVKRLTSFPNPPPKFPPSQSPSLFPFLQPRRRHSFFTHTLTPTLSLTVLFLFHNCCSTAAPVVALLLSTPGRQSQFIHFSALPAIYIPLQAETPLKPLVAVPSLGPVTFPPKSRKKRPFSRGKNNLCTTFHRIPFLILED